MALYSNFVSIGQIIKSLSLTLPVRKPAVHYKLCLIPVEVDRFRCRRQTNLLLTISSNLCPNIISLGAKLNLLFIGRRDGFQFPLRLFSYHF